MFGGILQAIEGSQISIGNQQGIDAGAGNLISNMTVGLQSEWMGPTQVWSVDPNNPNTPPDPNSASHALSQPDLAGGYWYLDSSGKMTKRLAVMDNKNMPITGNNLFTQEMQTAIKWIATQEEGTSGSTLTTLDAERQTWSSETSVMQNMQQTQMQPLTTESQTQGSNVQSDTSTSSSIASLANGMADLSGITASLIPNIK
jgi:hypothetical protein